MTMLFLCGLGVFAGEIPSFRCGCSPTGEPLFPSAVWGKACTTILESFRGSRKFFVALILNRENHKTIRYHHEGTKDTKGSDIYALKLRELRVLRG